MFMQYVIFSGAMRGAVGKAGAYWNESGTRMERDSLNVFWNAVTVCAVRLFGLFQSGTVPEPWNEKRKSGTGTTKRLLPQGFQGFFVCGTKWNRDTHHPPLKGGGSGGCPVRPGLVGVWQ
jgi:hypothetical protein